MPEEGCTLPIQEIPDNWCRFCNRGAIPASHQMASVRKCLCEDRTVRGGTDSGMLLNPDLPNTDALYPSHDHLAGRGNHTKLVVDARVVNDMKTILSEQEFWLLIEHLYAVGRRKGTIPQRDPATLPDGWHPSRNYVRS